MSLLVRAGLTVAVLLASACDPSKFDEEPSSVDAGSEDLDGATMQPGANDGGASSALDASVDETPADAASLDASREPGDAGESCARADHLVVVTQPAVELARLANTAQLENRVLGPLVRLGDSDHIWSFSSVRRVDGGVLPAATPTNYPYVAYDGKVQPWKATTPSNNRWTLREPTPEPQLPPTLLPLRGAETAQTTLVPSSMFRWSTEPRSKLFVLEYDILTAKNVWVATLEDGSLQATRNMQPLFREPPMFAQAARLEGDYVSLYACLPQVDNKPPYCIAGRVPTTKLDQASAYEVRVQGADGSWSWSSNLKAGTPVLDNVNGELSVSFNSYLGRYLAVYGEPFQNNVVLRTALQPHGPWSEPVRVSLPAPVALTTISVREHAPLAQRCERRVVISYFAPTRANGIFATAGEAVLAAIDLD